MDYWKRWAKAAAVRAVKTFAQGLIAGIGYSTYIGAVDWNMTFSMAALSAILSVLTSVAGIPEVKE